MILTINETGRCWICGRDVEPTQMHHCLPRHLKPVNNVVVPVCDLCHKRISTEDINGMYAYLFKIKNKIGDNVKMVNKTLKELGELNKIKSTQNTTNIKNE